MIFFRPAQEIQYADSSNSDRCKEDPPCNRPCSHASSQQQGQFHPEPDGPEEGSELMEITGSFTITIQK